MCVQAQDVDDEKKHKREIDDQLQKVTMALYTQRAGESEEETLQRAMRDPEIAGIMGDPVMQQVRKTRVLCVQLIHVCLQILQQAQQEPGALQDHMKNPIIRSKIQKLIAAGIIKTR